MKNNKGFSILELIVSFGLTMIIVVVLFEIIIYMKELYEKSVTQTELINRQNLITDYIYSDIYKKGLNLVETCADNCIAFSYNDGDYKQLQWDTSLNTIGYGDYTVSLLKNTYIDQSLLLSDGSYTLAGAKICSDSNLYGDTYFNIHIPITNALFPNDDFGINIFYTYSQHGEYYSDDMVEMLLPKSSDCAYNG